MAASHHVYQQCNWVRAVSMRRRCSFGNASVIFRFLSENFIQPYFIYIRQNKIDRFLREHNVYLNIFLIY